MNQLQIVLDALPVGQTEAIAIVRQMMAQEPVTLHDPIGKVRLVTVHKSYPGYTPPYTHKAPVAAQAVPSGFVLVPVEPTEAQLKAATACSAKLAIPSGKDYYKAMIAAAAPKGAM